MAAARSADSAPSGRAPICENRSRVAALRCRCHVPLIGVQVEPRMRCLKVFFQPARSSAHAACGRASTATDTDSGELQGDRALRANSIRSKFVSRDSFMDSRSILSCAQNRCLQSRARPLEVLQIRLYHQRWTRFGCSPRASARGSQIDERALSARRPQRSYVGERQVDIDGAAESERTAGRGWLGPIQRSMDDRDTRATCNATCTRGRATPRPRAYVPRKT